MADVIEDDELDTLREQYDGDALYKHIEEAYDLYDQVRTAPLEDGRLTLVGAYHDGEYTYNLVKKVLKQKNPDAVAVELNSFAGTAAHFLGKKSSKSELVAALHMGREQDASTYTIDANRIVLLVRALIRYPSLLLFGFLAMQVAAILAFSTLLLQGLATLVYRPILGSIALFVLFTLLLALSYPVTFSRDEYDRGRLKYHASREHHANKQHDTEFNETVLKGWRDQHMAGELEAIVERHDEVVAVVGNAHVEGITDELGGTWYKEKY